MKAAEQPSWRVWRRMSGMRWRYEELRQTGAPLVASLDEAAHASSARAPARRASRGQPRSSAQNRSAGFLRQALSGSLAAGAAAWIALSLVSVPQGAAGLAHGLVVEYTNLYTNETFSPLNPDASLQAIELSALGARVGVNLTPESVALPGLRFTVAFMLSYNGAPLGVVAYVDPSGEPVLLCIYRQ